MLPESNSDRSGLPRSVPHRPFPPYSYVTGKYPHPTTDRQGHSYGLVEPDALPLEPEHWQESEVYRYGIDLFNHGYYWEAHEAWEGVWLANGRVGPVADFLKGLIKLAAAGVKAREGRVEGIRRHAKRAKQLFAQSHSALGSPSRLAGLSVAELMRLCDLLHLQPDSLVVPSAPVVIVMPTSLILA